MDKRYEHKETGMVATREDWIASYDPEELKARELSAEVAFGEDEGRTLYETDGPTEDERRSEAARVLGRMGGLVKSAAKSEAAKARNARRKEEGKPQGGRPRKAKA